MTFDSCRAGDWRKIPVAQSNDGVSDMVSKRQARKSIASLQSGLVFRGEVAGVRQTYFVLEAQGSYFVLSFARSELKPGAGYFSVVDGKAVDYVRARFAGEKVVTAQEVTARARRTKHAPTSLVALNILYVLVALDEAKIVSEGQHRQLRFSIARRSK
jgi:hypothetical protein